jgi:hypothetical protein
VLSLLLQLSRRATGLESNTDHAYYSAENFD